MSGMYTYARLAGGRTVGWNITLYYSKVSQATVTHGPDYSREVTVVSTEGGRIAIDPSPHCKKKRTQA